jgi:hypothetical protein
MQYIKCLSHILYFSGIGGECEPSGMVGQLLVWINFQKAYGTVRRNVVHNILIEFSTRMKIFPGTKIDLNRFYCN